MNGEMGYGDFEDGRRIAMDEFLVNLQRNQELREMWKKKVDFFFSMDSGMPRVIYIYCV